MSKYRDFSPGDPLPADFADALNEFLGSAALNFILRIKPSDATKLQVPAGTDNDQVAIAINGKWRYITATIERASLGGVARNMDVFVTGSDNVFAPSGGGEIDSTVYDFGLAIVESAASPVGVALSRKVGTAAWSGTAFTSVDVIVGAQAGAARHAATHAVGGSDPVTPAVPAAHAATHEAGGSDALIGAWQALTPATGVSATGIGYPASARLEFGDTVRLKGALENTGAGTIAAGSLVATLPAGLRPSINLPVPVCAVAGGDVVGFLIIDTGGAAVLSVALAHLNYVYLDGGTFTLS